MKTIKCDRCGKYVGYTPPYINVARQGIIKPDVMVSVINWPHQSLIEVDLCDDCKAAVYSFIFDYGGGGSEE